MRWQLRKILAVAQIENTLFFAFEYYDAPINTAKKEFTQADKYLELNNFTNMVAEFEIDDLKFKNICRINKAES